MNNDPFGEKLSSASLLFLSAGFTLFIALCFACLFSYFHIPFPWLLGPISGVGLCAVLGVKVYIPRKLSLSARFMMGVVVGSSITGDALEDLINWKVSIVVLLLTGLVTTLAGTFYYKKIAHFSWVEAIGSAFPGGLGTIPPFTVIVGGKVEHVLLPHLLRVVTLLTLIPILYTEYAVIEGVFEPEPNLEQNDGIGFLIAILISLIAVWIGIRVRIPMPEFTASLIACALMSSMGLSISVPSTILAAVFVVIGTYSGTRFSTISFRKMRQVIVYASGGLVIMTGLSAGGAYIIAYFTQIPLPVAFLAMVPGGVAEMSVLATVLGVNPAYVSVHQALRNVLINLIAPLLLQKYKNKC
ncbi:AbrB family transcriptional regulator [Saccharospirillum alexandrii]|uniref:AbrB family transcriptional regulator n=1 Tax=Saccharospirillum alexandrii TaxID=2448477 RepID=UPI000FDA9B74|nr:AbrB family transcriptional regulator [Saccharospirillum alexandrii]